MKRNIYIICCLFASFSFIGCVKDNPTVNFENKSKETIDSIQVFSHKSCEKLVFKNIKPASSVSGDVVFCDENKWDGMSVIKIYKKGSVIEKGFGYYTNGGSLNKSFDIALLADDNISIIEN